MNIISTLRHVSRHPIVGQLSALKLPKQPTDGLRRLGNPYGGAWLDVDRVGPDSIIYSVGVGHDITFEVDLIRQFGPRVWGFDPTPEVIKWVGARQPPEQFAFMPYGIWDSDKTVRFYAPADASHVSHSIDNIQNTSDYFEAEVKRLSTVMVELGHERLDLLKLNIEGAEGAVLDDAFSQDLDIRAISVIFEQNESPWALRRRVGEVISHGYALRHVEGWRYTFSR